MRYLIAAGTRHYVEDPELPHVHSDVDGVVELFESMGYLRVLACVSRDPLSADFEDALSDWCSTPGLAADDVIVVYYAGHGSRSPSGQYRLACADSTNGRPRSWLSLSNLAETLATSPVRNVLFVIDACHAASAGTDIGTVTDTIVAGRARSDAFGSGTWLLASARHRDTAVDGAFVAELTRACRQGEGASQRFVAPGTIADRVNQFFVTAGLRQRAACSSVDQSEPPPFFVNPSFDPVAEVAVEGPGCADSSDLSVHFAPRGRGVEQVYDPGSYFTGRDRALREGRAHLAGEGDAGILVVTGDPGSGKSAVLGRLVLEGCADASLNAHHQTLEALVERLAALADLRATTPATLFAALADRQQPFRVIVDSLDEAGPGGDKAEARRIAWELLRPLAGLACVRLVVGSRRELLPHIGDRVPVIDLDNSAYADDTNTAEYVLKIISDTGAPYEHTPGLARQVAQEVARRAGRCFLVARMTASALLRGLPVDTTVPGWGEQLPSDAGGAFEAYLRRLPPERHETTLGLLTALSFGEGSGLSRRMWVQVASRLSGLPLTEAHIDALLAEDGSYLSHTVVDGTRYFRLYHQELTDHMKTRVLRYRDLKDVQECFVDALLGLVPDRVWSRAHPYVRAHLATHAAGSGALDDLIADASFVVAAEPSTLLPAVRHALRHPPLSMAVERYCYLLVDGDSAAADPAALLAFVAHTYGEHGLAHQAEQLSGSLQRIRVEPREITPHRVVGRHDGDAYATRSVNPDWKIEDLVLPVDGGRAVLAAPPGAPHVYVWLLDKPSRSTVLPHPADVVGLAVLADRTGRTEAVTLDAEGTVRVWDVADQTLSRTVSDTGYSRLFDAGFLSDGTPVVVCGDSERVVALSLATWKTLVEVHCPTPQPRRLDKPEASACLGRTEDGRVRLLTCDGVRGRVALHDLEEPGDAVMVLEDLTRPVLTDRIHAKIGTIAAVTEAHVRLSLITMGTGSSRTVPFNGFPWQEARFAQGSFEDPVLVVRDNDDLLITRLDGPPQRLVVKDKEVGHALTLAPVLHADRVLAVISGYGLGSHVTVVDCETGDDLGSPLRGHEGAVCAVRLLAAPNAKGPDILSISNDGTARLWSWGAHTGHPAGPRYDSAELEHSPHEVESLIPWSQHPAAVMSVVGRRITRLESALPHESAHSADRIVVRDVVLGRVPDEEDRAEDPDGTLNLLSWEYTGHVKPDILSDLEGWPASLPVSVCIWHRLRPGADPANTTLSWLHDISSRVRGQLLPPTRRQPRTRFVGFDAVLGRVRLLNGPEDTSGWTDLPWTVDPSNDYVCSAAFTTLSGDTVLMTGSRAIEGWEESVAGRAPYQYTDSGETREVPEPHLRPATVGRVWDLSTGTPHDSDGIELAYDVWLLVPHHGSAGTRWIAQHGRDGAMSVVDLSVNRQYPVMDRPSVTTADHVMHRTLVSGYSYYLRWAELPTGTPVLLCLDPARSDDSHAVPVTVWNATRPDATRQLPVPASRILWTGPAPSGETLVAVSSEHGVTLCHLPSCEEVWSTPLPALVTSLTVLPENTHLDLAVGTQQGVVFLRPRLSAAWRKRLATD